MDVEKTIQFLLEQQARFDARQADFVEQFVEQQGQSHERMTRIESVLLDVATAQTRTNEILATLTERHVELAQSHKALYKAQRVTEQSVNALSESQKATEGSLNVLSELQRATEQHLNALISAVERHIASHN